MLERRWGRTLVSSVPLPGVRGDDDARTELILKSIRRQEGWRDDRTENGRTPAPSDLSQANDWMRERFAVTAAGSVLVGTPNLGSSKKSDRRFCIMVAIPMALAVAMDALASGKPVTVIVEGQEYDPESANPSENEGDLLSKLVKMAADETSRAVADYQTWDDLPVNPFAEESPLWDRLVEATHGVKGRAQAALAIRFMGQGSSPQELRDVGLLNEESQAFVESLIKQKLPDKLPKSLVNLFYRTVFPLNFNAEPNEFSALSDLYDAIRQANILRKIHEAERKGSVAVVLCTARHAYNLKSVVEGMGAGKQAATVAEIVKGLSPAVSSKAGKLKPKLVRANTTAGMWTFEVPSSDGPPYTVKVKANPRSKRQTAVVGMDVQVSCNCDFWQWQGPMYWASTQQYLYGTPPGDVLPPDKKDPEGKNRVCKHVAAVFARADNWHLTKR